MILSALLLHLRQCEADRRRRVALRARPPTVPANAPSPLPWQDPLEASLKKPHSAKHAKESPFVGSKFPSVGIGSWTRMPMCRTTTDSDLLANLQGQLTGEST